jgi:hypothetical protein
MTLPAAKSRGTIKRFRQKGKCRNYETSGRMEAPQCGFVRPSHACRATGRLWSVAAHIHIDIGRPQRGDG